MTRNEMIQNIASELVHEYTNFMSFNKAQAMAEIILARIEQEGMLPPEAVVDNGQDGKMWSNEWEEETLDYKE